MSDHEVSRFLGGQRVYDPVAARRAQQWRDGIAEQVFGFVDGLDIGQNGIAVSAEESIQPDGTTCFYASLEGVARALTARKYDVDQIGQRARSAGLLGPHGAETSSTYQDAQTEFVRKELDLDIGFYNLLTDPDESRIHAMTSGLVEGKHVIFGLPGHWVALDGIHKYGSLRGQAVWTGMNPAGGNKIDRTTNTKVTPAVVARRLIEGDLPVVVVNGIRRRFAPADTPRRISRVIENPRRITRVTDNSQLFSPGQRRIKRATD